MDGRNSASVGRWCVPFYSNYFQCFTCPNRYHATSCCRISQPSTVGLPTFIQLQLIPGHIPPPPHSRQPRRPHLGCTLPPLPSAPDASWLMSIVSQVGATHANPICWHVWAKRLQLLPFSDSSLTVICHSTKTTSWKRLLRLERIKT